MSTCVIVVAVIAARDVQTEAELERKEERPTIDFSAD